MPQITFPLALGFSATTIAADPTTSGPIKLPGWAPDIAAMSTTTIDGGSQGWYPSTTIGATIAFNPGDGYTRRCFCMKTGGRMAAGEHLTINYKAVGELIRT